jgi:hypothetical protein
MRQVVLGLALAGCVTDAELERALDRDRDGFLPIEAGGEDCDETRASVNPAADEICGDGVDNDCDGVPDDDGIGSRVFYVDADGDGFGADGADSVTACVQPEGYAPFEGDCADDDPSRNPNAEDLCDGIDQNCDGVPDDDELLTLRYPDADGDGFGVEAGAVFSCDDLEGFVLLSGDCDDADPTISPVTEDACNGQDDNCNGLVDEDAVNLLRYRDADGDQWGTDADTVEACQDVAGYVLAPGDCDDADPATNPAALDTCDGVDRDCNGVPDDDAVEQTWYEDADGDGFGDDGVAVGSCAPISGFSLTPGDCDDADAGISPAILDGCDGFDQNCNGILDEDAPLTLFYEDADGDGSGVEAVSVEACAAPPGFVQVFGDCDDGDASIRPGSLDPCDGIDQDCDGAIDETAAFSVWYEDADGDGLGDGSVAVSTCDGAPSGYVAQAGDCDDTDALVTVPIWYADGDGDGYGTDASTASACVAPAGFAALSDDCDDSDPLANPGEVEVCNNFRDDDCSSETDCRLEGTHTTGELALSFVVPDGTTVTPLPDVVGTPEADWAAWDGATYRLYEGPVPSLDGTGALLDCMDSPHAVPGVSGATWDLACDTSGAFVVYEAYTLGEWIRVETAGVIGDHGHPLSTSGLGPGVWVPVDDEVRFYGRSSQTVNDTDVLHSIACPGTGAISAFEVGSHLVIGCEAGGDAASDTFVFDSGGMDAANTGDAAYSFVATTSLLSAASPVSNLSAITGFVRLDITGTGPADVQSVVRVFEPPFSEPLVATATYEGNMGNASLGIPYMDLDTDGVLDWVVVAGPDESSRVDVAYGGDMQIELTDVEFILLPTFGSTLEGFEPVGAFDVNADGFADLALVEEDGAGVRTVYVLIGGGE